MVLQPKPDPHSAEIVLGNGRLPAPGTAVRRCYHPRSAGHGTVGLAEERHRGEKFDLCSLEKDVKSYATRKRGIRKDAPNCEVGDPFAEATADLVPTFQR